MSDNWIALISEDPGFVPDEARQDAARVRLLAIAPDAKKIKIKVTAGVQFFDCGANFERVICSTCGREVNIEWWQARMDDDYGNGAFKLNTYMVPCCGALLTLAQLKYEWPQGFARFSIDIMNPCIGELSEEQRHEFERILGTPLRVIYQCI